MALKNPLTESVVPETPDRLFRDLTRRRRPDALPHQAGIMCRYGSEAPDRPDVALQLPTGSVKTLVGLLIAVWRRRKFQGRIVYLCPTKQLVNQVAAATMLHGKSHTLDAICQALSHQKLAAPMTEI